MIIECGDLVKDEVTGFTGVVTSVCFYDHGNKKATVLSRELKDGKVLDAEVFDFEELEIVEKQVVKSVDCGKPQFGYGDIVKENHTGWEGKIRSIRYSRTGCIQYGVYPPTINKEKEKPSDGWLFLENELTLVKKVEPIKAKNTGSARIGHQSFR